MTSVKLQELMLPHVCRLTFHSCKMCGSCHCGKCIRLSIFATKLVQTNWILGMWKLRSYVPSCNELSNTHALRFAAEYRHSCAAKTYWFHYPSWPTQGAANFHAGHGNQARARFPIALHKACAPLLVMPGDHILQASCGIKTSKLKTSDSSSMMVSKDTTAVESNQGKCLLYSAVPISWGA